MSLFAAGLKRQLKKENAFVGIYAKNRAEWCIADLACICRGYPTVPLPSTLDIPSLKYIIQHSNMDCVVCSEDLLSNLQSVLESCPNLKYIVVMEDIEGNRYKIGNTEVVDFRFINSLGAHAATAPAAHSEDDIMTILYTSGSTGRPKGAVNTYQRWNKFISFLYLQPYPLVRLSFMPLAHTTERQQFYLTIMFGGKMNMENIFEEFKLVRPTTLSAAPRFYDSIHTQYQAGLAEAKEQLPTANPEELEKQVLEQCRMLLGGDIQWLVIGGAASSQVVKDFMVRCFQCKVFDGYGTTEAGGIATDESLYPNVEIRLVDVPDMGYTNQDTPWPRGEIVVRTPQMIEGYYKDEEATKANFDDGWFRTGDIGEMAYGHLKIIDRKKNLFKLVQGVFVAPSSIENILLQCAFVDQIYVYGDIKRSALVAIVVPSKQLLMNWAQTNNFDASDLRALYSNPVVIRKVLHEIAVTGKQVNLQNYEIPAAICLETEYFTSANGLLTPSDKLVRHECEKRYKDKIEELYSMIFEGETKRSTVADELTGILKQVTGNDQLSSDDILAQVGTDSLSTVKLVNMVKAKFNVEIPISVLLDRSSDVTAQKLSEVVESLKSNPNQAQMTSTTMLADADMDMIIPTAFPVKPLDNPKCILLTGVTGFLGSFLLDELLKSTHAVIYCLVRANSDEEGIARIKGTLEKRRLIWEEHHDSRVVPLLGDLGQKKLGLSTEMWHHLANILDMVVHCGATVNWLLNYEAIRGPNVLGTAELIDLASDQFLKPFVFVSTASTGYTEEGEMLPPSQILRSNPYAISKWVAEKLVRRAGKAGLPISIFKPGMITGSSTTGASNPTDYVSRYIRGLLRTRTFFHSSLNVELIPVDFVAKVIVALGLATQSNQMTYHIANNNTITYSQLASLISARVPLTAQPYINFRQAVVSDQANPLWALLPFFGPTQFNMNMLPATDTETRKALPVGLICPQPSEELISKYVEYLSTTE